MVIKEAQNMSVSLGLKGYETHININYIYSDTSPDRPNS